MLEEVLSTLSISSMIENIVVVSKDEDVLSLAKKFKAIQIIDHDENGVNNAVSLADDYLKKNDYSASVVFPQDIPFIKTQDIDFLLRFQNPPRFALIVPSRRFDGTNALVRMPVDLMATHYDEDSYKIHLSTAKSLTPNTSLIFVRRLMLDIDNNEDLNFVISRNEKNPFCTKVQNLLSSK